MEQNESSYPVDVRLLGADVEQSRFIADLVEQFRRLWLVRLFFRLQFA